MDNERYAEFRDVLGNLNLFPLLSPEEIEKFRVPYGQRTLAKLKSAIRNSGQAGKLIFTGHRGCGKSTLLAELAQQLRGDKFYIARFSIAETMEMSDVNHISILYSIALKLLSQATKSQMPVPEETKAKLINWFTQTKSETYSKQLKQELAAGVDLYGFFSGKLQKEGSFREEIKVTYERRVSELSDQIDRIATTIQTATGKEVLVLIDDLDKLDLGIVKTIFQENVKSLFSPRIRVVFTIPIAVIREAGLLVTLDSESDMRAMLPVTKFYPKDVAHEPAAAPLEKNVGMLEEILEKRIPNHLIEPAVRRRIVLLSGGVLREMMRIGQECCRECMLELELNPDSADVKISADILAEAVKSIRNQFARPLGSNRYELLTKTYENFTPPDAMSDDFLELLHGLYVLEYENDDLWYDLHPVVTDLLKRRKLIGV
ncbi:MAG: ATP-binding protein [Cyanobacteria bacterium P01_A01_bin.135]